jgi:hypothetical protein
MWNQHAAHAGKHYYSSEALSAEVDIALPAFCTSLPSPCIVEQALVRKQRVKAERKNTIFFMFIGCLITAKHYTHIPFLSMKFFAFYREN